MKQKRLSAYHRSTITNLNPVKDVLVVSLVLDQPVQLFGHLCRAELRLLALLRLVTQCELHILQTERLHAQNTSSSHGEELTFYLLI